MRILVVLIAIVAAFASAVVIASETGGEVVVVTTADSRGVEFQTSLWIVDYEGAQWLRAGSTDSGWYQRLANDPLIRMERGGETRLYRAIPEPEKTEEINALMARDYGLADQLIGLIRDESKSMAIRLDEVEDSF